MAKPTPPSPRDEFQAAQRRDVEEADRLLAAAWRAHIKRSK